MKDAAPAFNKWLIAVSVMPATFLSVMDVTVVNTAMPHMMGNLGQTLSDIAWVGTAYSIAEIIMIVMTGWWSALIGRRRLLLFSLILFTTASVLCGQVHSFSELLFFRVLQGVGGGSMIPITQAILRETFPPKEQGLAMGFFGMGVVVAPAIGPVLGGWLTDTYGWPWVFYINLPVAIFAIVMAFFFVWDPPYLRRKITHIDWPGIALLAVGLSTLQIVMEQGQEKNWFDSRLIVLGAAVAAASLIGLVFWEMKSPEPIINFRLLKNRSLAAGSAVCFVTTMALYGTTFIMPQLLQNLLGYTAYESGLTLLPRALILFALMPVAGWLYNYFDARALIISGVLILTLSYYQLAHLSMGVAFMSLIPIMLVMGAGQPFTFVTLSTAALSTVERQDMTMASGLFTLSRRVGGNLAYAWMAAIVDRRSQFHHERLIESAGWFNPAFVKQRASVASRLVHAGLAPAAASLRALEILNGEINRQATLLAYNDSACLMGILLIACIPLILLLPPSRARHAGPPPEAVVE